jgi:hypothetical protein
MQAKSHRIIEVRMSYTPTALTVFILEHLSPLRKLNRDWHSFTNHDSVQSCGFATNW